MKRREFIALIASAAAAWPLAARAQQAVLPVVGFLNSGTPAGLAYLTAAFRQGLNEAGYVEGRNVAIEYRWAEGQYDRLRALAADLIRRQVSVIAATTTPAAVVAKTATSAIPIVFTIGADPIAIGLVDSLSRPKGNATGVNNYLSGLGAKRLELLRALLPNAAGIAVLVNPNFPDAASQSKDVEEAGRMLGQPVHVVNASSDRRSRLQQPPRPARRVGGAPQNSCDLLRARVCCGRWPHELRGRSRRRISPSRDLRRPDSQGCQAG
jgi:putative ABC transport system substrate-binding protein